MEGRRGITAEFKNDFMPTTEGRNAWFDAMREMSAKIQTSAVAAVVVENPPVVAPAQEPDDD